MSISTAKFVAWVGVNGALLFLAGCGGQQSPTGDTTPAADMAAEELSGPIEITAMPTSEIPAGGDAVNTDDEGVTPDFDELVEDEEEDNELLIINAVAGAAPPPGEDRTDRHPRPADLTAPPTPRASKRPARPRGASGARHPRRTLAPGVAGSGSSMDGLLDGALGSRGEGTRGGRRAAPSRRRGAAGSARAKMAPRSRRPTPTPSKARTASPFGGAPAPPAAVAPTSPRLDVPDAPRLPTMAAEYRESQSLRVLTAATVPDADRRAEYLDYLLRHLGEAARLALDLSRRARFRVVDAAGHPVHDALLTLIGNGYRADGRTHADGRWDFFPSLSAPQASGTATLFIQTGTASARAQVPVSGQGDGRDILIRLPGAVAVSPPVLDLAFLIDVTGSMSDELRYVNEEVVGIVGRLREAVPNVQVRVAATFYRDRGDIVPISQIPFSTNLQSFVAHMRLVEANGGGDYPEDLNSGLAAAMTTLQWSQIPAARVLVVIADAPPQHYQDFPYTYLHAMTDASRRGIRLLPVAASGANREVEYLFRAMGAFTSTPYVYLTDDSGVGGHHMEADTDRVSVEMFSDLLTRLLISDLRGQGMHEPSWTEGTVLQQLQ